MLVPVLHEAEGPPTDAEVSADGMWATLYDERGPVKVWARLSDS